MIQLSYNPITGANYHFELIEELKRRKRRNPIIEKKAMEQLTRVANEASFAMKQLQGALYQYGNLKNNSQ